MQVAHLLGPDAAIAAIPALMGANMTNVMCAAGVIISTAGACNALLQLWALCWVDTRSTAALPALLQKENVDLLSRQPWGPT